MTNQAFWVMKDFLQINVKQFNFKNKHFFSKSFYMVTKVELSQKVGVIESYKTSNGKTRYQTRH